MKNPLIGLAAIVLSLIVTACANVPVPVVQRSAQLNESGQSAPVDAELDEQDRARTEPQINKGSGEVFNRTVAAGQPPELPETGQATFNFEGESLHAVVKVVLGDLLQQNYVIAPGVQGTVTLATPQPVGADQALSLLEMVLSWNNAAMVWSDGRYNIVPSDQAVAGNLSPRLASAASARGYELRAIALKFISASEMEKLLKPYARSNAIVQIDPARNLMVIGGTRSELQSYMRTIDIFDVDWLAGMSVGVFTLESAAADQIVGSLEDIFGAESQSPMAGMFRFMPVEGTNSVIVITSQPNYLRVAQDWISKLDAGGEGARLYVYEVKYMKAEDISSQLGSLFGGSSGSSDRGVSTAPGLTPQRMGSVSRGPGDISRNERETSAPDNRAGGGSAGGNASITVGGGEVSVSSIAESNSLLVRASPTQWESIRRAIDRLDQMPAQVHIEAHIVEVDLTGNLSYGVSWFFDNDIDAALQPIARARNSFSSYAGRITPDESVWSFVGRDANAILSALDSVTDVRILQSPSVLVRNNVQAEFDVGQSIPVTSTSFNPGLPGGDGTFSQVQYLRTGVLLIVTPRIGPDGTVFMQIEQEVSSPGAADVKGGNRPVNSRMLKTEAIVQSGETVLLAGLIDESDTRGSSGLPGLSRIPVIGGLFGKKLSEKGRREVVIMITPTVVRSPLELRKLTDEYGERFRALEPLRQKDDSGQ